MAAERAARVLRVRVMVRSTQAGWMLFVLGLTPFLLHQFRVDLRPIAGPFTYYLFALPWGLVLFAVNLRPIDAVNIRRACIFIFCALLAFAPILALTAIAASDGNPIDLSFNAALPLLLLICAALLWPTLNVRACRRSGAEPMPPRRQLLRLWLALRLFFFGLGLCFVGFFLAPLYDSQPVAPTWRADDIQAGNLFNSLSFLAAALVLNSANRGRVHRWLGSLGGKRGSKDQEAASVASLTGSSSAADALSKARDSFRAFPLGRLTREALANNTPNPALHAKTDPAVLGAAHAFVSHSWTDDGNANYDRLHEWANGEEKLIWLDKFCIDQLDIEACVASLPVFLAGCQQLVCLAGPTYTERLWCAMELFTFVRMGGRREDILVWLFEQTAALRQRLAHFDAGKAKCFHDRDRHSLLAVVEATFGTIALFNRIVRKLLSAQLRRSSSISCSPSSLTAISSNWSSASIQLVRACACGPPAHRPGRAGPHPDGHMNAPSRAVYM